MKLHRSIAVAFGAAVLVLATATSGHAQGKVSVEGHGGIAIPAGDLADLYDVGPNFGANLEYNLNSRVAIRIGGDVDILSGVDMDANGQEPPDLNIYHYNAGIVLRLVEPGTSEWSFDVNANGGGSTFDSDTFTPVGTGGPQDFSETYFTFNGGLRVGYDLSPRAAVFVGGQVYVIFADETDSAALASLRTDASPFDTAVTIPVNAGILIHI
ncbi:MAG: OmpA family protein [Gemmatimonadota bacterium]